MIIEPKRLPFFYGWVIIGISFVTLALGYGTRASFSVFLVAIQDAYGWKRGAISAGFTLHMIVAVIGLPFVGAMVDRYGPRVILCTGVVIMAIGMWQLGGLDRIWHFYIFYGLVMAFGRIMIAMTPHTAIISNWFVKKRGTAMGLAAAGISFGSILMVPLVQFGISHFGWRYGCAMMACLIFLVLFPLNAVFQRLRPSDCGLLPDGEKYESSDSEPIPESKPGAEASDGGSWTVGRAIRTPRFWLLYFAFFFGSMIVMIDMHQIAFYQDVGFARSMAVTIFAAVGLVQSTGVFCGGALSDKVGREPAITLGICLQIIGILILIHISDASIGIRLLLFIFCYGFGNGFRTSIMPTITADLFPGRHVASVYGVLTSAMTCGTAFGPLFAGYIHDVTGTYAIPFRIVIGALVMACVFVWLVAPRKIKLSSITGR